MKGIGFVALCSLGKVVRSNEEASTDAPRDLNHLLPRHGIDQQLRGCVDSTMSYNNLGTNDKWNMDSVSVYSNDAIFAFMVYVKGSYASRMIDARLTAKKLNKSLSFWKQLSLFHLPH